MRLIYTDEAGTSAKEPVCVVAAIVVNGDTQWRPLESEMRRIIAGHVPARIQNNFIFHATDVFSGSKKISREEWPFRGRLNFLKDMLCLPYLYDAPIAVGVEFKKDWSDIVPIDQIKFPGGRSIDSNKFSHLMAFNACMERADLFLRRYLNGTEIGSVIAEDLPEMKRFLTAFGLLHRGSEEFRLPTEDLRPERWQEVLGIQPGAVTYKIDHIVDVPHFVTKGLAPLLQLADACAFAFRHFLSGKKHGDDLVLAMLGPYEGAAFVREPTWLSNCSSGLFNTSAYWSDEEQKYVSEMRAKLRLQASLADNSK